MVRDRQYYRYRRGAEPDRLTLDQLVRLVSNLYTELDDKGWFQLIMGKNCVDDSRDVGAYALERLGWDAWPLERAILDADEDALFTIVEFLYDSVAEPTNSYWHNWSQCGIHVTSADIDSGRAEFRTRLNSLLGRYERSFELRENGEVWESTPTGLEDLEPPASGDQSIDDRVQAAISSFRRHGASDDDKRRAVRDLADVLEYLRSTGGTQLPSKDEGYLFDIANNFGIRHHNPQQRTEYDSGIWLDWVFYAFLNAINMAVRLRARASA